MILLTISDSFTDITISEKESSQFLDKLSFIDNDSTDFKEKIDNYNNILNDNEISNIDSIINQIIL